MKTLYMNFAALTLAAVAGCNEGTPGGPGATAKSESGTTVTVEKPVFGQTEDTFNLTVPLLSTSLKQGGTQSVTIGVSRDKNFVEDVALAFGAMPEGVTISPDTAVLSGSSSEAVFTLTATDDASLGDFTVKFTGHPTKGADASSEFKLNVAEK